MTDININPLSRVTAVMITFNSARVIKEALDSLPSLASLVIVDNASKDQTVQIAQRHLSKPTIIEMPENRGYGTAANTGLEAVETEFGVLLNVDLALRAGCIEELVAAADRYPDGGMFGACCWEPDGTLQFGRQPHLSKLFPGRGWSPHIPEGDCCAAYAGGAAMFFRMKAFREIGGFDEELFLFGDDDDICNRLTEKEWSLVHVASAHADHKAGKSTTGVSKLDWWKQWHMAWSRLHLERKANGEEAARRFAEDSLATLRWKALLYKVLCNRKKADRFGGRLAGTKAFLDGKRAQDVRLGHQI